MRVTREQAAAHRDKILEVAGAPWSGVSSPDAIALMSWMSGRRSRIGRRTRDPCDATENSRSGIDRVCADREEDRVSLVISRVCPEATYVPLVPLMESSSEPAFKSQRLVSVCAGHTH